MNREAQVKKANDFLSMHHAKSMFILPNVWDLASAVIFAKQGFKAIATTSAGIAYANGLSDGEVIEFDDLLPLIKAICQRVEVPVSVDIERGYARTIKGLKENLKKVIQAGAIGVNIEDGYPSEDPYLEDLDFQLEKIKALVELKKQMGIPFVINARTCAVWLNINGQGCFDLAMERGQAFAFAGADCVFIPGAIKEKDIARLTQNIKAPLNLIANPMCHDYETLNKLGVKRLSIGSGAIRAVLAKTMEIADDLYENKSINAMLGHDFSYAKANELFKR